jgi:hypothetical protein
MQLIFITTCKPFKNNIAWKQEQSMKSWTLLDGKNQLDIKIVVVGNDYGVKEICEKYNFIHKPDIKTFGTVPYLVDMLELGYEHGNDDDIFFWTNSDMTYGQNLIDTILEFKSGNQDKNYMMVGQRWDWAVPRIIDNILDTDILQTIIQESTLHATCGIDYIIHSKTTMVRYLDKKLVIAGTEHDMKMLNIGLMTKIFCCDTTNTITAIHHNHEAEYRNTDMFTKRVQHNRQTNGRLRYINECPIFSTFKDGKIIIKHK